MNVISVWRKVASRNLCVRRKAKPSLQWFLWTQSTSSYKCLETISKFVAERFSWCFSRCVFNCFGVSQTYSSHWRQAYRSFSSSWSSVRLQRSGLWHWERWCFKVVLSLNPIGLSLLACWVHPAKGQYNRCTCLTPVLSCHYRSTWHSPINPRKRQRHHQYSSSCW